MRHWFPIFLLPFVTLGIPMLYVAFDLIGMSRQHSTFASSHPGPSDHADVARVEPSAVASDRSTLVGFVRAL